MILNRITQISAYGFGAASFAVFASGSAFAANPDFRITHQAVRFANVSEKTKETPKGSDTSKETTVTTSQVETFPAKGLEIAAFLGDWAIYNYPGSTGYALWVGYTGIPNFEVGPTLAISGESKVTKVKDTDGEEKVSKSGFDIGFYAYYGLALGFSNLELTLAPTFKTSASKTEGGKGTQTEGAEATPAGKTETTGSGFSVFFDATLPISLAENFEYAPGLDVTFDSMKEEIKDVDKKEIGKFTVGINFAKFRYSF